MKLYFKPGACSLASHIVLREIGAEFDIDHVDTSTGKTQAGEDFTTINPNGYVPALRLADGEILSEGTAILQYLADQNPSSNLAPEAGTLERARLQQHLNFVASELHKAFSPFFSANPPMGEAKSATIANLARKMEAFETHLADGRDYLLGKAFSVADAYLFVVANWANLIGIGLDRWPNIAAFVRRVAARPASQAAMRAEGLI